jgi:hypothetical protein
VFTTEIKVNGVSVGHLYGVNKGPTEGTDDFSLDSCIYDYEYYRPGDKKITHGTVIHKRKDGIEKLVIEILKRCSKKKEL